MNDALNAASGNCGWRISQFAYFLLVFLCNAEGLAEAWWYKYIHVSKRLVFEVYVVRNWTLWQ